MKFNCLIVVLMMTASLLFAEGEVFEPTNKDNLEKFYSVPERSVTVSVDESVKLHSVSSDFLGVNLSYFNDTDTIWKEHDILDKLKKSGVKALRYPGGEETSFFHWQSPGVNGYEDLWAPEKQHGTSPGRGRFQVTWVAPSKWETNKEFMDFDEFMFACKELKASPIVGLNLSSGKKYNRRKEGVQEALKWLRYCRNKKYEVKYWFLDNEPWHFEAAHTFSLDEYADEVLLYGKAIKKEFPNVKLIANPTSSTTYNYWEGVEKFIKTTGDVIDYIDVHWYWAWGLSSFDYWLENTPLETGDKWKNPKLIRTFSKDIAMLKDVFRKAGHSEIGLVSLEWNIGPSDWSQTFNQSLTAIIQAELLMEFVSSDVHITCLWPLIWQSDHNVWSERDFFPSIITRDPPFNPTLSLEMFRMLGAIQGKSVCKSNSSRDDLRVLSAVGRDGEKVLFLINKNTLRRQIKVAFKKKIDRVISAEMIGLKHQVLKKQPVEIAGKEASLYIEPYSFVAVRLK